MAFVLGVFGTPEIAAAGEYASYLQGGLSGGRDQTNLRTEDTVEGRGDQRIVRAPEDDGVYLLLFEGGEVLPGGLLELKPIYDATLYERDETGGGLLMDFYAGVEVVHDPPVRPALDRALGRQYPDVPVACLQDSSPRARDYNPDYGYVELGLGCLQGRRRRRIARDDDYLNVQTDEVSDDLECEPPHLVEVSDAVRHPRRIPEVDGVLVGEPVPDFREHRQPTYPRVEDAYGTWIAHGAALYTYTRRAHAHTDQRQGASEQPAENSRPVVVEAAGFEPASANAPPVRFYERRTRLSFALLCEPGRRREASP